MKFSEILIAVVVLAIILLIIVPLSPFMLDAMLILNIAVSVLVLIISLYMRGTLEFSTFPTLLLVLTLFRLALNISATRLILGNSGAAGTVIRAFGGFVVGSNVVVGVILFVIIVLIQFIVITKGAERVAEVAARFTLDAMPGKQMAIDADLSAGLIDEDKARKRRTDVQREADFYGAMDGASKFVKGDAILAIIVTVVNAVGGIIIGALGIGGATMTMDKVVDVYVLATIGNGLCNQIPALMVSSATGIIVTRSASDSTFGNDLMAQLFSKPYVLLILSGMLAVMSFIPGLPPLPLLALAGAFGAFAYASIQRNKKKEAAAEEDTAELTAQERRKPESVASLLQVDLIEMEFGYGIISLVDASQGGDLLDRVVMIRRQCALELGIVVPVVRLRDNMQLGTNEYCIKIKGLEVARGEVMPDHYLALKPADTEETIEGIETTEPAFGLPAVWVDESERARAEVKGYATIDAPSVIATHLMETIKRHAHELLSRQQVQMLLDNLKRQQPALVEEVVPKMFSMGDIQKILAELLREGLSVRDIGSILEIVADHGTVTRDTALLAEYVRQGMKRAISRKYAPESKLRAITVDPQVEQMIAESIKKSDHGAYAALEPGQIQAILVSLKKAVEKLTGLGIAPVILTAPAVRRHFKRMSEQLDRDLAVLSYNEIESYVEIYSDVVVSV